MKPLPEDRSAFLVRHGFRHGSYVFGKRHDRAAVKRVKAASKETELPDISCGTAAKRTGLDHVRGDRTGLIIPAHAQALRGGGAVFLTEAFRRFGAVAPDNSVTRITGTAPCVSGSTGAKLFLSIEYDRSEPGLATELFVRFSRDFRRQAARPGQV